VGLSILITQCMQRDFIEPLAPHDPLPNALHVGRDEARRLLGATPSQGPLAQLMHWARALDDDHLTIVHVRDWHDPEDPAQKRHLQQFGMHCIQGTRGAELVLDLNDAVADRPGERFVDATTLNDFADTTLEQVLRAVGMRPGEDVRIGVIGVWTEAKVSFLLYELLTRCRVTQLATCSALTASASRAQHFNALEQLRKILGVQVFDSVGEFAEWLAPDEELLTAPAPAPGMRPAIEGATLTEEDAAVVSFLYRDAARLTLDALGGGFSGASVYRTRAWDALGHEQSTTVLKLGERALVAKERVAFERVEQVLGNDAPRVLGFADFAGRAGLKYAYAAMGRGSVRTFKDLYESGLSAERLDAILTEVFGEILGRFTSAAQYERLPLLDYYTFSPEYADGVRAKVAEVMGDSAAASKTLSIGGDEVMNVADFYAEHLEPLRESSGLGEFHYVSYVHGDLNGANILLDERDNVWLIDFFHAHRGHVVRDLAKLESDLLFIFTPMDEDTLEQGVAMLRTLYSLQDLRAPVPAHPGAEISDEGLLRAWAMIRILRRFVGELSREDRDPGHMHTALLRYAVHTQWFDESSPSQRRWALAAAGMHADALVARAKRNDALWVGWLEDAPFAGKLGMTICPGRTDRGRDLGEDLDTLEAGAVTHLVGLLPDAEMEWAGVTDMPEQSAERGIDYLQEPILDQRVPSLEVMGALVEHTRAVVEREGGSLVVHCMGGLGRSGTLAACTLVSYGVAPGDAIASVRVARGPRAVETELQERFVSDFARWWGQPS